MKRLSVILAAALAMGSLSAGAAQAGCLGGAVVGGVAGHFAGRHGTVGALGGCAVGHHMAVQKKRERAAARAERRSYR